MKNFGNHARTIRLCTALLAAALAAGCGDGKDPILGGGAAALAPAVTVVTPHLQQLASP